MSLNEGWTPAGKLPSSFEKLPADDNWKDVRANLPGKQITARALPTVFVSFEPAELIQLQGQPAFAPVAGTSLLWVSNTESDLFKHTATGAFLSPRGLTRSTGLQHLDREARRVRIEQPSLRVRFVWLSSKRVVLDRKSQQIGNAELPLS